MKMRAALLVLLLLVCAMPALAQGAFFRLGVGFENFDDVEMLDRQCDSTTPVALFGCANGIDGRQLGAYGEWDDTVPLSVGIGYEISPYSRFDVSVTRRSLALDANANFPDVGEVQTVRGEGHSTTALLSLTAGFGRQRVQPFISVGGGFSRNTIGPIEMKFPGIDSNAVTTIRGGGDSSFAWSAEAGLAFTISPATVLELSYRYRDLGHVETDDGTATIVRPAGTTQVEVAGTRTDLRGKGIALALRMRI
jgi:opacity protein-like surface antigen